MSRKKRKNNDEEKRKEKHLREEENNYNYKYKYIYMSDVVEINELQNIQDPIICSYCEKNISKYPMNLQDVAFKLLCGSNCYYHLKCFTDLCNESDFDSFNCINCGAGLVRSDCQYASALLDGEEVLLHPELFYAHPEQEGGSKKIKKRKNARKNKRRKNKTRKKHNNKKKKKNKGKSRKNKKLKKRKHKTKKKNKRK